MRTFIGGVFMGVSLSIAISALIDEAYAQVSPETIESIGIPVAVELSNDPKQQEADVAPESPQQTVSTPRGQVPWGWVPVTVPLADGTTAKYLKKRVFKGACSQCGCGVEGSE